MPESIPGKKHQLGQRPPLATIMNRVVSAALEQVDWLMHEQAKLFQRFNFLETKRNKCLTQEERDRYTTLAYHAKIEALAGRYIRNAGVHVKLEKLRSLPTGEKE